MAAPGMDQFDMYFRRADLDGDGRISGAEAVSFFQGSNLPKHVLAQIWMHADQGHTGFLGRAEFYNALRLVTVAQSKRELTPDIVKAALYGPAAAKIPAPKINLPATSVPQSNSVAAASAPTAQMGLVAPAASPNVGFGGKVGPNASMNHQYFPAQQNNLMRPTQVTSTPAALPPSQGIANPELARGGVSAGPHISNSNISHDWLSGNVGATSQVPIRGPGSSMPSTVSPRDLLMTSQSATKDSKASAVSGNGFTSGPNFGGDVFSPFASQPNQGLNALSNSRASSSSATVLVCSESQASLKSQSFDSLQSGFTFRPAGGQFQRPPMYLSSDPQGRAHITSVPSSAMPVGGGSSVSSQPASGELQRPPMHSNSNQQAWAQSTSIASSRAPVGVANSVSNQTQLSWSKMKPSDVQKYTKVFLEVDSDKDGRITGQQARNLFLSWRLPREVLKQVWDLSDQDNDSMLSLREFCIALYLMERYREGCSLPTVLPSSVMYDETLLSMTGQGLRYQQGLPVAQPMTSASPLSPSLQAAHTSQTDGSMQSNQQRPEQLLSRDPFADFGKEVQSSQNTRSQEATEADKKVEGTGKMILDSREKIEFFHKKMQELVLYKSRCDNRLNEITERASADKREAESLAKKYEEKYKQVAEIASKLTVEEAKFHDTQERKMELQQAIVNMERGGSSDGILQVRVDRIQSDLDELMKALSERCKKHSVHVKSTARVELPIGWQSGIQEGAAEWDEDWDKFEDEGFSLVTDLRANVQNDMASQKENSASPSHVLEAESACAHSEDDGLGRSPPDSPAERMFSESSPHKFSNAHSGKSTETDTETNRSFDESTWGAFDNHDDTDSVWGFNPSIRDSDTEKHRDHDFFGSDNLGAISVRTSDIFQKRSPFSFDDSVPSTPLSKFGNSPRYSEAGDHFFDNMSRFDSFATREGGLSPRRENLTRFDSINSTADFGHGGSFTFDDSDPFGSTGPFKATSEGQNSRRETGNWGGF